MVRARRRESWRQLHERWSNPGSDGLCSLRRCERVLRFLDQPTLRILYGVTSDRIHDVVTRAATLTTVLLALMIDLVFLGGVVFLNWVAQHLVFERVDLHGTASITFDVLEWTFTCGTVGTVLGYVLHDTVIAIARPWRRAINHLEDSTPTGPVAPITTSQA